MAVVFNQILKHVEYGKINKNKSEGIKMILSSKKKIFVTLCGVAVISSITGCANFIPQSGPSTKAVKSATDSMVILKLTPQIVLKMNEKDELNSFKKEIDKFLSKPYSPRIGKGDIIEVQIYEAPPPVLFSISSYGSVSKGVSSINLPSQFVDDKGYISVPFAGRIFVLGKRPEEVALEIQEKLSKIANNPQVIVKVPSFISSTVTVFGHVKESKKVTLGYTTLTLLDVLSSVGGITSPIDKTLIRITRKDEEITIPAEDIITDPSLNINLEPGDVITVIFQDKSATFLGATGKNVELEFEAKGISLSQALGRVGGLKDEISHAKGLFVFRFENKEILDDLNIKYSGYTKDNKVPVVYNIDMSNPNSIFVLRDFKLKDKDIIYVSDAPSVQLSKFLSMVRDIIQPVFMIKVLSR